MKVERFSELRQFVLHNTFSKCFAGYVLLGIALFVFMNTTNIVFLVNNFVASSHLDSIMKPYTDLASGWIFVFLVVALLFISQRKAAMMAVCGIMVLLCIMILKYMIFTDELRPTMEFGLHSFSHTIPDYSYLKTHSFPSGHTLAAFAIAGVLSSFVTNKYAQIGFFFYAVLIAFSRIYLLHHFYRDVFWGAIVAYCVVVLLLAASPMFAKIPEKGFLRKK
ncbi:MAG: phosphatase PAP2 family protein [Bacteroidales bacterium]|jgi:membrane-associated phospholipid phosphatase|nr:phosphatase PAP2 family protein [Bacteroidales bacterium]